MSSACDGAPSTGLARACFVLMGWSLPVLRQRRSWYELLTTLLHCPAPYLFPPVSGS